MSLNALLIALQGAGFPLNPVALAVQGFIDQTIAEYQESQFPSGADDDDEPAAEHIKEDGTFEQLRKKRILEEDEEILAAVMAALTSGVFA